MELPDTLYCVVQLLKNGYVETVSVHEEVAEAQISVTQVRAYDQRHVVQDVDVWQMRRYKS